jgi:hypothetical protein
MANKNLFIFVEERELSVDSVGVWLKAAFYSNEKVKYHKRDTLCSIYFV